MSSMMNDVLGMLAIFGLGIAFQFGYVSFQVAVVWLLVVGVMSVISIKIEGVTES